MAKLCMVDEFSSGEILHSIIRISRFLRYKVFFKEGIGSYLPSSW